MASSDLEKSFREYTKTENVFLFVPNIIGYVMAFEQLYCFYNLVSPSGRRLIMQNEAYWTLDIFL